MNYYEQDDKRRRMWGIMGVALYLALCVGVMFITYTISLPEPEMGILVDFGTSDTGSGEEDLATGDLDTRPVSPPQPRTPDEPVMTTDDPEAPEVVPETRPETPPAPTVPQPEPVREVDRRALFPGRTEGSDSNSQGSAGGEGNQGTQDGAPGGSDTEGGAGIEGFTLTGRDKVGDWPLPIQGENLSGRVVISIIVDRNGKVSTATFEAEGSNTNNGELVTAARNAALRARFTPSEAEVQTGTITYIFRLD